MHLDGMKDLLVLYSICFLCQNHTCFCMEKSWIFTLYFRNQDIVFFTERNLFLCREAFGAIMQNSCDHRLLIIISICHGKASCRIHDPKRMLIAVFIQFFFQSLLYFFSFHTFCSTSLRLIQMMPANIRRYFFRKRMFRMFSSHQCLADLCGRHQKTFTGNDPDITGKLFLQQTDLLL